jgi:hypothetical protein
MCLVLAVESSLALKGIEPVGEAQQRDIYTTPDQLSEELLTLTLLPRSKWQTLLNLETIKVSLSYRSLTLHQPPYTLLIPLPLPSCFPLTCLSGSQQAERTPKSTRKGTFLPPVPDVRDARSPSRSRRDGRWPARQWQQGRQVEQSSSDRVRVEHGDRVLEEDELGKRRWRLYVFLPFLYSYYYVPLSLLLSPITPTDEPDVLSRSSV